MTLELKLINILSITTLIVNAEYNIFSAAMRTVVMPIVVMLSVVEPIKKHTRSTHPTLNTELI
jgi:hypothetical protein